MAVAKRLIVVEDEPFIALALEDMAQELGYEVEGLARSESEAFKLLNASQPDAAILDINLGTETSLAVASSCLDRGIRIVFVTGYDPSFIRPCCFGAPILAKPFSKDELFQSLGHPAARDAA